MKLSAALCILASLAIPFPSNARGQIVVHTDPPVPARPSQPPTAEQIAKMPVIQPQIADFKLISQSSGWASTASQLFWTNDNGTHWKDISPPNPSKAVYASVFFTDAETGWVLLVDALSDDNPNFDREGYSFYLSATADGGSTWSRTHIAVPQESGRFNDRGILAFSDRRHGWLSIDNSTSGLNISSALFSTSDGGATWKWSKAGGNGAEDGILAVSLQDTWLLCRNADGQELDVSHDGGASFQTVVIPAPAELASLSYAEYGLPSFSDASHGYEAVKYSNADDSKTAAALFATEDGGRTWRLDRVLASPPPGHFSGLRAAMADSSWLIPLRSKTGTPELLRLGPSDRLELARNKEDVRGTDDCRVSFVQANNGWFSCSKTLFSTTDGGGNWTAISPRTRNGAVTDEPITPVLHLHVGLKATPLEPDPRGAENRRPKKRAQLLTLQSLPDQHLGFDISAYVAPREMQIWWNSSPFYDAIFYGPGAPTHKGDLRQNATWISQLAGQGWGIFPVWSGYQSDGACAPPSKGNGSMTWPSCNRYKQQIDPKPDDAAAQGAAQADAAVAEFQALGFDGHIVYLDVEAFNDTASTGFQLLDGKKYYFRASAEAYMGGFVNEMHAKGALAGLYGSASNIENDFAPVNPDDIYIADSTGKVTVWGMGTKSALVPDSLWPNKQRIHQYKEEIPQTWGGVTLTVDLDLVDATIAPGFGIKEVPATNFTSVSDGSNNLILYGIQNGIGETKNFVSGTAVGPEFSQMEFSNEAGFIWTGKGGNSLASTGANNTIPVGINNRGQIVGYFCDEDCPDGQGFLYTPKLGFTTLDFPGAAWTELYSINDAGWIVGGYGFGDGLAHCVLFKPLAGSHGDFGATPFGDPEAPGSSYCEGINGIGQIAGSYWTDPSGSVYVGFVDDAESGDPGNQENFVAVNAPDGFTMPIGINNNGAISGNDGEVASAFLIADSKFLEVQIEGISEIAAFGLNDDVELVGWYSTGQAPPSVQLNGFVLDTFH